MGEHAVVYGKPALLAAINLRLTVTIEKIEKGRNIEIISSESIDYVKQATEIIRKSLDGFDEIPIRITIASDFPAGYHLGSSASLAVALTGALMKFFSDQFDIKKINDIAYRIEKIAHGNPSGGDNTIVTYGYFLWFRKELEFLKTFSPVTLKYFGSFQNRQNFFLIDTGRPKESTKDMIISVKKIFQNNVFLQNQILDANEKATKKVVEALYIDDEQMLIDGIREGEKTLEDMGVVSEKVKPLIRAIEHMGGAAKILGGGGKTDGVGYLFCYYRDDDYPKGKKDLGTLVKRYSYSYREIRLGVPGVMIE